jgi:hypothetical protein
MASMGLQMGLEGDGRFCKRQFRWMFTIDNVIGDLSSGGGIKCLPPEKSARPNLSFKEMNVQHLSEEVFYPAKPDWKPIQITVFDLVKSKHPIWQWLNKVYVVSNGAGVMLEPNRNKGQDGFIRTCSLQLFNGCGVPQETWVFEDAWPQAVNFQTLDMTQNGIVMCDLTLRYARAYIK